MQQSARSSPRPQLNAPPPRLPLAPRRVESRGASGRGGGADGAEGDAEGGGGAGERGKAGVGYEGAVRWGREGRDGELIGSIGVKRGRDHAGWREVDE